MISFVPPTSSVRTQNALGNPQRTAKPRIAQMPSAHRAARNAKNPPEQQPGSRDAPDKQRGSRDAPVKQDRGSRDAPAQQQRGSRDAKATRRRSADVDREKGHKERRKDVPRGVDKAPEGGDWRFTKSKPKRRRKSSRAQSSGFCAVM